MEDIVHVIDGRAELRAEIKRCGDELRNYLRQELTQLSNDENLSMRCQATSWATLSPNSVPTS